LANTDENWAYKRGSGHPLSIIHKYRVGTSTVVW
jgi:hypothetical protein